MEPFLQIHQQQTHIDVILDFILYTDQQIHIKMLIKEKIILECNMAK